MHCPNGCEVVRRTHSAPALDQGLRRRRGQLGKVKVRFELAAEGEMAGGGCEHGIGVKVEEVEEVFQVEVETPESVETASLSGSCTIHIGAG